MFNEKPIRRREGDGYFDATAMCKAVGKRWAVYYRNESTQEFIEALERSVRNLTNPLIQSVTKGLNATRGTWIHPQVAIHLAQWCSPEFAVFVSGWILTLMTTGKVELKPAPAPIAIAEAEPSLLAVLIKQTQQTNELIGRLAELMLSRQNEVAAPAGRFIAVHRRCQEFGWLTSVPRRPPGERRRRVRLSGTIGNVGNE